MCVSTLERHILSSGTVDDYLSRTSVILNMLHQRGFRSPPHINYAFCRQQRIQQLFTSIYFLFKIISVFLIFLLIFSFSQQMAVHGNDVPTDQGRYCNLITFILIMALKLFRCSANQLKNICLFFTAT